VEFVELVLPEMASRAAQSDSVQLVRTNLIALKGEVHPHSNALSFSVGFISSANRRGGEERAGVAADAAVRGGVESAGGNVEEDAADAPRAPAAARRHAAPTQTLRRRLHFRTLLPYALLFSVKSFFLFRSRLVMYVCACVCVYV
jgi:hypothetical protein